MSDTIAKIDIHSTFKRTELTIKPDGSEDHLVSSRLKALIWDEMNDFRTQLLNSPHPLFVLYLMLFCIYLILSSFYIYL